MKLKTFFANKNWNLALALVFLFGLIVTLYDLMYATKENQKQWRWIIRAVIYAGMIYTQMSYYLKKRRAEKIKDQSLL